MTKLSTAQEKPPQQVVDDPAQDEADDDDDPKKNLYSEIDDDDDTDDDLKKVDLTATTILEAEKDNAANENLYAEINLADERFENAVYMHQGGVAFVCPPKTRSFYPAGATTLPPPPKIPEEPEPSWCCGTRRRRRRSLILGLLFFSAFLLFLCIALLVKMFLPTDEGYASSERLTGTSNDIGSTSTTTTSSTTSTTAPPRLFTAFRCTSWQTQRLLSFSCDTGLIRMQGAFYGWSKSEAVCSYVKSDTTCRKNTTSVIRNCDGLSSCSYYAGRSTWVIGCVGAHDYLQVYYYCY